MNARNKVRILSHEPRKSDHRINKIKERGPHMLKKVPSGQSDANSPLRLTQKIGQSPYRKQSRGTKLSQVQYLSGQRTPLLSEVKWHLLQKKISEQKLQDTPYLPKDPDLIHQNLLASKLISEDNVLKLKVELSKKPKIKKQFLFLTKGNNHQLLKEIFVDKYGFSQASLRQNATICWLQSSAQKEQLFGGSRSLHEDHLPEIGKMRIDHSPVIYNYLQGQSQLTNKERLFKNMKKHFPQSIGTYIPRSFVIDFRQDQGLVEQSLLQFIAYYFKKDTVKKPRSKSINVKNYFVDINISQKTLNKLMERSQHSLQNEPENQEQKSEEQILWILKPTSLNRGRGIHLFSTLKQLSKLLSETSFQISVKMYSESMKPKTYIIQQYISRPLLIDGFKFDMRFWVLMQVVKINGKKYLKAYLFQHGYSRLASIKFQMNESPEKNEEASLKEDSSAKDLSKQQKASVLKDKKAYINNRFIHLTNNAVQKEAKEYGQFCEGNQLSLEETVQYFKAKDANCCLTIEDLRQRVKKIVAQSLSSVKERLVSANIPKTFQLLGYDFLLDQSYNLWFIEVNCNPCLEESSQLVGSLLRKMLEGLINLTALDENRGPDNSEGWLSLF